MVNKRAGFTLFELMLVMAIILVAAAITIPAIDAMMSDGSLKAARDMVRARWADIRGRAMKEGRPYKFSTIDQSKKFKIEPEDSNAPSDSDEPPIIYEGELPGDIVFTKAPHYHRLGLLGRFRLRLPGSLSSRRHRARRCPGSFSAKPAPGPLACNCGPSPAP